ncbi:hypothetical protein [Brucella intermedia]|uniref:hypothetical protein n=1 Tax=Brucella intermedia TaxID=94625 RepID=UPI00235E4603|nr:hypothetical protein [Brucella intermedia]
MTGLLSKLLRVSDKATALDAFFLWASLAIILSIALFGQGALVVALIERALS